MEIWGGVDTMPQNQYPFVYHSPGGITPLPAVAHDHSKRNKSFKRCGRKLRLTMDKRQEETIKLAKARSGGGVCFSDADPKENLDDDASGRWHEATRRTINIEIAC